jgi:hypothetical protein
MLYFITKIFGGERCKFSQRVGGLLCYLVHHASGDDILQQRAIHATTLHFFLKEK